MGSMEKAIKTGFICRLCSEMNKVVIHIYSDLGLKLKLSERIHEHLPVKVSVTDPLPKTVCWKCIARLEEQHKLVQRINYARKQQKLLQKQVLQKKKETLDAEAAREAGTTNVPNPVNEATVRNVRPRKRHSTESTPSNIKTKTKHYHRRPRK
ncbi:uncharacterized protein LOC123292111 [Chrysoperla carnea]|uniref:uncharacterized protein LOC123292111 n=1 Tax=Chrysoperla carnea TaxID=189513 RepID=UPI001D07EB96|nr:uncharacterized protein LOC123292111 [Chrysoperla carnea]